MMIVDNILNKQELLSVYAKMLDRNWYLSRGSLAAGKENKYGMGIINENGHTFAGYTIKSQKSGRVLNSEDYIYFESLLPKISDKCYKKYGIKLPTNIFRMDVVAKQRGAQIAYHKDHHNPNAYSLIGLLSPEWKQDWGGEFYYQDDIEGTTNIMHHNPGSFIIMKSNLLHNGVGPKVDTPYWRMIINYVVL